MKPVLTADEYRRVDNAYEGDLIQAMDKAGYAVALAASGAGAGYGKRVVILALHRANRDVPVAERCPPF